MNFTAVRNPFFTVLLVVVAVAIFYTPATQVRPILGVIAMVATITAAFLYAAHMDAPTPDWDDTGPSANWSPAQDPWEMMRMMMHASGQQMPDTPMLTKGGVMYAALNLEEQAETLVGIVKVLDRLIVLTMQQRDRAPDASRFMADRLTNLRIIRGKLQLAAFNIAGTSTEVRNILKGMSHFEIHLHPEEALEIFDGTTDVAVVNCGFALSCGFDGAEGYAEVQASNLSKANPATGVIDKTPDGKWIKGVKYREPNLARVLGAEAAAHA